MPITIECFFHGNGLIILPFISYGKNSFGISPRIWIGLRTYTEVPLYVNKPNKKKVNGKLYEFINIFMNKTKYQKDI
jgi:hypothetical protein